MPSGCGGDEVGKAIEKPSLKWTFSLRWIEERNGRDKLWDLNSICGRTNR